MESALREEIWFARIAMIIGAKELVDAVLNLVTIIKLNSGLAVTMAGTNETTAIAYLLSSAVAGIYLVSGGRVLSRIAYGRAIPRPNLLGAAVLPDGPACLSLAFRTLGALQLVHVLAAIALMVVYRDPPLSVATSTAPRFLVVEGAWALERLVIGLGLLMLGGRLATFFVGRLRPAGPPPPASGAAAPAPDR